MVCADCHTANDHQISGSRYATRATDPHGIDLPRDDHDRATCESCHGATPHKEAKLDDHTNRVACQSCHIPEYARGGLATKMLWDWSTAGKRGPRITSYNVCYTKLLRWPLRPSWHRARRGCPVRAHR